MPKKEVYQAATQEFFNQVTEAVKQQQHFTLETNFRDYQLSDIVAEFKRHGYTTNMVYMTLENIEQSIDRVNKRVLDGGHFVDHKNIKQNYDLGLQYLEHFAGRFDNLEIMDASGPGRQLRSLLSIQHHKLEHLSDQLPERVAKTVNAIADRYQQRQNQKLRQYRGPKPS